MKFSPFLLNRKNNGKDPVTTYTMLVSSKNEEAELLVNSKFLTTARTAEIIAIAIDKLISNNAKKLAIIGSGAAAQYHLKTEVRDRNWGEIRIFSLSLNTDATKKKIIKNIYPSIDFKDNTMLF